MTNEVRVQIDQINTDNTAKGRKYATLDVITFQPLLRSFVEAQGDFIPREIDDFRAFVDIYQADGTDFFPVEQFIALADRVLLKSGDRPSDVKRGAVCAAAQVRRPMRPIPCLSTEYCGARLATCWTGPGAARSNGSREGGRRLGLQGHACAGQGAVREPRIGCPGG
jgi:hypothetical protein